MKNHEDKNIKIKLFDNNVVLLLKVNIKNSLNFSIMKGKWIEKTFEKMILFYANMIVKY